MSGHQTDLFGGAVPIADAPPVLHCWNDCTRCHGSVGYAGSAVFRVCLRSGNREPNRFPSSPCCARRQPPPAPPAPRATGWEDY